MHSQHLFQGHLNFFNKIFLLLQLKNYPFKDFDHLPSNKKPGASSAPISFFLQRHNTTKSI